jgi:hypothetical protein
MRDCTRNRSSRRVTAMLAAAALLASSCAEMAAPPYNPVGNPGYPGQPVAAAQQPQPQSFRYLFASTIAAVLQTASMGIAGGISGGIVNWFAAKMGQNANNTYANTGYPGGAGQYPNTGYGTTSDYGGSGYPTSSGAYPTTTYPSGTYPGSTYPSSGYPSSSYPNTASTYPSGTQSYPNSSYPSSSTPQYPSSGYPNSQDPNAAYQSAGAYPNSSYPQTGQTYPNSGYPSTQNPNAAYQSAGTYPDSTYSQGGQTYPGSGYPQTQNPQNQYPGSSDQSNGGYGSTNAYGSAYPSGGGMIAARDTDVFAGIAYEVHALTADGHWVPVEPMSYQFRTGDRFMVYYRPSLPGRMQVYNVNPAGKQTLIDAADMAAAQLAGLGPYEFTALSGEESLRLVLSPCSTPQLLVATRDIVKSDVPPPSNAQTGGGVHLENCGVTATRSADIRTRDIQKVAADGTTSFALDPVSQQELSSGQLESRQVTIVFHHI